MPQAKRASSSSPRSKSSGSKSTPKRSGSAAASARSGAKATGTSARKGASRTGTQAKSGATRTRKAAQSGARSTARSARSGAKGTATAARRGARQTASSAKTAATRTRARSGVADNLATLAEQLSNRIIKPFDLVMLTRDRIQETLHEAAERGRVTRADADELVAELVTRGRKQTDEMLGDLERVVGRGRSQLESATRRARRNESVDRVVRSADRARRSVGVGPSFPILGYDDLSAGQVEERLSGLSSADLRKVRDYERRHANRKSVLAAVERSLA